MSCGPAQVIKDLAEKAEEALQIADKAANALPYGAASVVGFVEANLVSQINEQVSLLKDFIDNPLSAAGGLVPGLPSEIQSLIEAGENIVDLVEENVTPVVATGIYISNLKDKYSDLDIDIDNIVEVMEDLGNDLDLLCKIVPNIQNVGGELIIKGFPVSFPDISPGTILTEGKFPNIVENIVDAAKNVDLVFVPDEENQGIKVSEEPGAPYRENGTPRSQRNR